MTFNRRNFLLSGLAFLTTQLPLLAQETPLPATILKPPRLKIGDTVGLISPASPINSRDIEEARRVLAALGLKVKLGAHLLNRHSLYLAGTDAERAADVNAMFADSSVQAIIAMRGGWGCNRILPLLEYNHYRASPKILMGYSDITALLLAIYAQSGIVTFHGPVGTSTWNSFTVDYLKHVLFNREAITMHNPLNTQTQIRVETITPGKARGKLVGGNLSVLAAMVGSAYLPSWKQAILFVEEVEEEVYHVDRMLTQLKLAGILEQIGGFVFGQCTDCKPKEQGSLILGQVLREHIQPLGIPAWYGSMIGHIKDKFTLPVGIQVEIDASQGTIQMLESAVN